MSWVRDHKLPWYEQLAVNVLKVGPVPTHVAFIMDGNRRFARKAHMEKEQGHSLGFDKLTETLHWCLEIGIREVTVYAFSIENFKRSDDEVATLMRLAREKFARLIEERDKLNEAGVCIRIIGNFSLLPEDLRKTIAEAMLMTKNNRKAILNVAFAYTSRDEMTNALQLVAKAVQDDVLQPDDITKDLIDRCMYTSDSPEPDLLVRTSGESRLSDFLLWQTSSTVVYFTKTLWPEFTIWHFLGAVFFYQRCHPQMQATRNYLAHNTAPKESNGEDCSGTNTTLVSDSENRRIIFYKNLEQQRYEYLTHLVAN